jgi:Na+/H+ antiporter NhaC
MEAPPSHSRVRSLLLPGILLVLTLALIAFPVPWRPLWPAMIALVMVFATRRAASSLLTACLAGALLTFGDPNPDLRTAWIDPSRGALWSALASPWHYCSLIFTLLLGSFAAVIERSNGLLPLLRASGERNDETRRRFLTSLFGLGLLCFFDGLANALMLGRVARPVADRLRVPRAFLAYLVDTTSSAVACLAFLSTWIVFQLGLIQAHSPIDSPPYLLFLQSIPRNYYCLFALLLAFLAVRRNWMIGPMRSRRPEPLGLAGDGDEPAAGQLHRALLPLAVLLLSIPGGVLILYVPDPDHLPVDFPERVRFALNASSVPFAFIVGSALALAAALVCFPRARLRDAQHAALQGARQLLPALGILLLAWILGSLFSILGTAEVFSQTLGDRLPLAWFPAGVFLLGCAISFVSGTSWGTMAILMPIVLPAAGVMASEQGVSGEALAHVLPGLIAAVFGGAVFGDHCSPYSDTTIVSALASGVSTSEHTITQLPYALLCAATAVMAGYLPLALGLSPWLALLLGAGFLWALVHFVRPGRG